MSELFFKFSFIKEEKLEEQNTTSPEDKFYTACEKQTLPVSPVCFTSCFKMISVDLMSQISGVQLICILCKLRFGIFFTCAYK